jgi:ATP-dependent helicase/nuclease subunit A
MTTPAAVGTGWFVEASAGTGKTTELVSAIVSAVESGVPIERIAAVTFTHQAAGEMKGRVHRELTRRGLDHAVRHLDRAFIGTIHSFCAALIRQRPVEACVDPEFTEIDEGEARRFFAEVFHRWFNRKLADPPPAVRRALAHLAWLEDRGASPADRLRESAWSLAAWRDQNAPWERRPMDRKAAFDSAFASVRSMLAQWPVNEWGQDRIRFKDIVERLRRASAAGAFDLDWGESELRAIPKQFTRLRFDRNSAAREPWGRMLEAIAAYRRETEADLAAELRDALWEVVDEYQTAKAAAGLVDFTDLLLYARDLICHEGARAELQARYQRIFADEFQDTDPLQAEILEALAGPDKLFVVGDPKQSIYRFRRAEPKVYEDVRARLLLGGAGKRELKVSYRSTEPLQAFVNAAFRDMPRYLPLTGGPPAPVDQPAVVALPMPEASDDRSILRCSPPRVAAFIEWLLKSSGWTVREKEGGRRAIQAKDICVLFRRFVNNGVDLTQEYVRSLEARGIDHVLVGSKGLHAREEAGVVRAALRAIESPDDELNVYAVLRGPLFAIPDSTLLKFRETHHRFAGPLPDDLDPEFEPVREALDLLYELHRQRNKRPTADTLRRLLAAVRAHASLAFYKGPQRRLANLHRLAELARKADAGGTLCFRAFVEYLEEEARGGEAAEAPVLEQKTGGVRMMTVHKAKGLEFPVVILADLSCKLTPNEPARYNEPSRRLCAQRLIGCAPWELIDHEHEQQQAEVEEAVRLAYVAATRACDLLVVAAMAEKPYQGGWLTPLYEALYPPQRPRAGQLQQPLVGSHEVLWFHPDWLDGTETRVETTDPGGRLTGTREQILEGRAKYEAWRARRDAAIRAGERPLVRTATAAKTRLAPEAESVGVDVIALHALAQRPAGARFGLLMHAVLQSGPGTAELHARRFGATEGEARAAEAAAEAVFNDARIFGPAVRVFREFPVLVKLDDGTLIEGRADLVRDEGDCWTVIDYKTGMAETDRNKRQLQLYAYALSRATGKPARGVLLEI